MKRPSLLLVCKAFLDLRFGGAVLYGFFFFFSTTFPPERSDTE